MMEVRHTSPPPGRPTPCRAIPMEFLLGNFGSPPWRTPPPEGPTPLGTASRVPPWWPRVLIRSAEPPMGAPYLCWCGFSSPFRLIWRTKSFVMNYALYDIFFWNWNAWQSHSRCFQLAKNQCNTSLFCTLPCLCAVFFLVHGPPPHTHLFFDSFSWDAHFTMHF